MSKVLPFKDIRDLLLYGCPHLGYGVCKTCAKDVLRFLDEHVHDPLKVGWSDKREKA